MSTSSIPSLSSGALSRTLLSITGTKINEVAKQMKAFEAQKKSILGAVEAESDQGEKVRLLLDGLKSLRNSYVAESDVSEQDDLPAVLSGVSTKNVRWFLDQSRYDPSVSPSILKEWENKLRLDIDMQGVRYDYAFLFGRLVTEWLSNPTGDSAPPSVSGEGKPAEGDSFIEIGRKEMYEQREIWESYAFSPVETDASAIESYLSKLFSSRDECKQELKKLREHVKKIGADLMKSPAQFNHVVVKEVCIKGLLASDLLSDEKRAILMEFSINETVLTEVADVLNLRLASLDKWNWNSEGLPIELRRKLNGKYRVFMDEDILEALFLQYIGVKWGVGFKVGLQALVTSSAWKQLSNKPMTMIDRKRREYFLGPEDTDETIQKGRRKMYETDYFMTLLPANEKEAGSGGYDAADAAESDESAKSGADLKQSLLHLLSTESLIHQHLYGQFTIIQSDFKWFGPSLPHSTIFAVLKFFGVSEQWITFFRRFLEAPLKFVQDGPEVEPKLRKRGTPMSHALSEVFGEVLLFGMDFAVNQGTDGALLYRLHDDIWFWGQEEKCVNAWKVMNEFADVMGISFNEEKTGSVRITKNRPATMEVSQPKGSLPEGGIRWGFLKFDPTSGVFVIDQSLVDSHVEELQRQLAACKSVFSWIQAWNSYLAKFFVLNFCQPAHCFGRQHLEAIIKTFQSIQRSLFGHDTETGSVTQYLSKILKERFAVTDIPDGFFYFPIEVGGLGLHNPFISLFAMRENICKNPMSRIEAALELDEKNYRQAKEAFEDGTTATKRPFQVTYVPEDPDTFMELQEFLRYGEITSSALRSEYDYLLSVPIQASVEEVGDAVNAMTKLPWEEDLKDGINGNWMTMYSYYRWIVMLYGTDMIPRFGGLSFVDEGLLPVGIVRMLQSKKMQWEG